MSRADVGTDGDAGAGVDDVERQFLGIHQRFVDLSQSVVEQAGDDKHTRLLVEVLEELSAAIEELEVSIQEIHAQNEALEASQVRFDLEARRYRDLFEGAPDGYVVTDDKGLVVEANAAAAELLSTPVRVLLGKPLIVFVERSDRRNALGLLYRTLSFGRVPECEIRLAPAGGRAFPASVHLVTSRPDDAGARTVRWLLRDVSRRVAAEDALAQERARNELVGEDLLGVVVTADSHGRVVYVSPSVERVLGYRSEEVESDEVFHLVHTDDRAALADTETRALAGEARPSVTLRVVRRSGSPVRMEVTVVPLDDADPSGGLCYTLRDVQEIETSRVTLQSALARERHATIALREADAAKDALLLAASHDLSSPVAAVVGLSETLARHPELPEGELRGLASGLATAGTQLRGILGNLLDAERVLGGHVQVRSQPSDLRALVVAALHTHGLGDSVLLPERGPVLVEIDAGLSARIIDNVVSNALRHTPAGTPIQVRLDRGDEELTLCVSDRGPGVPDEAKERVFEPFQRHGPSTGLGLGLFVVRRFAELQGGRAWVQDTEGGGATFCVTFASVDAAG